MAYPKTVTISIETLDMATVKSRIAVLTELFNANDIEIRYYGWAVSADKYSDTIFADSGITVKPDSLARKKFTARVDGSWLYCYPSVNYEKEYPQWRITFTTTEYLDVR